MMIYFHSSVNILHAHRDTVCDDQPSSSTTGHDFAKSSRRAHSGLFIVDIDHYIILPFVLSCHGLGIYEAFLPCMTVPSL